MSRKRRIRTKLKRCFAMFLSLCIMFSMFQGVAWADMKPEEEGQLRDVMIELDGERLLSEAGKAIQEQNVFDFEEYGMSFLLQNEEGKLVISEDYRKVLSSDTGTVYVIDEIPYMDEAAACEVLGDAMLTVLVKVDDKGAGLGTASNARRATESNARKGTPGNALYENGYELTGDEQFIFLLVNPTKDEINLQISINGQRTGVISVGRESALPAGEVVKEAKKAEETKAEGQKPAEAKPDGTVETPAFQAPSETAPVESLPEMSLPEEGSIEETESIEVPTLPAIDIENTESTTEETGGTESVTETRTEETAEAETEESINQPETGTAESEGTEEKEESDIETEATEDESSQEVIPEERESYEAEEESNSDTAEGNADSGQDPDAEALVSDDASEVPEQNIEEKNPLSVSSHKTYRVGTSMGPIEGFVDEEDRDGEWDKEIGNDTEEENREKIHFSDEVIVVSEGTDGVELETYVLPTVLMEIGREPVNLIGDEAEPAVYTRKKNAEMPSAGIMMLNARSLGAKEASLAELNLMKVNLYNYDEETLNNTIRADVPDSDKSKLFLLNLVDKPLSEVGHQNRGHHYMDSNGEEDYAAHQGIMGDTYDEAGKIALKDPYLAGGLNSVCNLFPETASEVVDGVTAYIDVPVGEGVFQLVDGYYRLNAFETTTYSNKDKITGESGVIKEEVNTDNGTIGGPTPLGLSGNDDDGYQLEYNTKNIGGNIGFWPFNLLEGKKKETFGMKISFDFRMYENGVGSNGKPAQFTFAGDDDVWVYLKDRDGNAVSKLALDLGGIHGATAGTINFQTGVVTHYKVLSHFGNSDNDSRIRKKVQWYLYNDCEDESKYDKVLGLERPSAKNGKNYTLDFYYMERGGKMSSCYIDFNLSIIPKQEIRIQKNIEGTADKKEFQFQVISSDDPDALVSYRNSNGADGNGIIKSDILTLNGAGRGSIQINKNQNKYFYVEELNAGENVEWSTSGIYDESELTAHRRPGQSYIYERTSDKDEKEGYLIQCTNVYDGFSPEIKKAAWRDGDNDVYDIALEVSGGANQSISGGLSDAHVFFAVDTSEKMGSQKETLTSALENTVGNLRGTNSYVAVSGSLGYDPWTINKVSGEIWMDDIDDVIKIINDQHTFWGETGAISGAMSHIKSQYINKDKTHLVLIIGGRPEDSGTEFIKYAANDLKNAGVKIHIIEIHDQSGTDTWVSPGDVDTHDRIVISELESALANIIGSGSSSSQEMQNPIVYDTLSPKVAPENSPLEIWAVSNQEIAATGVKPEHKTNKLKPEDGSNGLIIYSNALEPIAWYNPTTTTIDGIEPRTIKWKVADSLGDNESRTLIFRVKVTNESATTVTSDLGTGTHAGEEGYYSNGAAYLTYRDNGIKNFPRPVVQQQRKTLKAALTVEKEIANPDSVPVGEKATRFEINLKSTNVYSDVENKNSFQPSMELTAGEHSEQYEVYLDSEQGGTITVEELLAQDSHFQLDSIAAKDAQGNDISITGNNHSFAITPGSHITVTVTNRYVNHNPIKLQKFVNGKSEDKTEFTVNLTECTIAGSGEKRKVTITGSPVTTKISAADGERVTSLKAADTTKYYIVEEQITDGQPYILDSIQAIDEADGNNEIGQIIDDKYIITVSPTSSPFIKVSNKTYGRVRVVKQVTGEKADEAPAKEFMIHVTNTGNTGTYVDTTAIIRAGEGNGSGWIMIDKDTALQVTETELKEFKLDSIRFSGTDLATGQKINWSGRENLVRPGEEVTITVTNAYVPQNFFDGDSSKMNDFNPNKEPVKPIIPKAADVAMAVERRFLTTEEGVYVLEPRELPERLL